MKLSELCETDTPSKQREIQFVHRSDQIEVYIYGELSGAWGCKKSVDIGLLTELVRDAKAYGENKKVHELKLALNLVGPF